MKSLRKKLKYRIFELTEPLKGYLANDAQAIVISGIARSGTTWLAQIVAEYSKRRIIFEPLHHKVPEALSFLMPNEFADGHRRAYPYLRPDSQDEALKSFFKKALKGQLVYSSHLVRGRERTRRTMWWTNTVVKMIHGNLLLAWLTHQFHCKTILIVRHPAAVVASMAGQYWAEYMQEELYLALYLEQPDLMEDWLSDHIECINRYKQDPFSRMVIGWCINYWVPLQQIEKQILPAHVVSYEALVQSPEATLEDLLKFLDNDQSLSVDELIRIVDRPSSTIFDNRENFDPATRVIRWKQTLSREQIEKVEQIVDEFGEPLSRYWRD